MLNRFICNPRPEHLRGANQVRQQLTIREHSWRGNANSHPVRRATHDAKNGPESQDRQGELHPDPEIPDGRFNSIAPGVGQHAAAAFNDGIKRCASTK
jgi:hypothetical protein